MTADDARGAHRRSEDSAHEGGAPEAGASPDREGLAVAETEARRRDRAPEAVERVDLAAAETRAREDDRPAEEDGPKRKGRPWLKWLIAALALAAVVAALWLFGLWPFGDAGAETAQEESEDGLVPVATEVVGLTEIPVYYEYNAVTFASRQADIRPRVTGYIEEVAFAEGTRVEQGQLLYRLDAQPFEAAISQARAEREAVEASLAFATAQVARFETLVADGFATGERYDEALARREELRARLGAIEAGIEAAQVDLDYAEVEAPFPGVVGLSRLHVGELAAPGGAPLTTLVELDPIEVHFEVREDELPRIRSARLAGPVRVVMLLDEERAYAEYGELKALDNAIDPTTGTLTAVADFPNPDGLIPPGALVDARLILGRADALLIPAAAMSASQDRRIIYKVGSDGRAVSQPIRIGRRIGERVVVTEGLVPGDRIVVDNLQAVRDGAELALQAPEPRAEPQPHEETGDEVAAGDEAAPPRPPPLGPTGSEGDGLAARSSGATDLAPAAQRAPGEAGGEGSGGPPLVGARPTGTGEPGTEIAPVSRPNPALTRTPTGPGAPTGAGASPSTR